MQAKRIQFHISNCPHLSTSSKAIHNSIGMTTPLQHELYCSGFLLSYLSPYTIPLPLSILDRKQESTNIG